HVIAAGMAVDFHNTLGIGLHHRARERAARLGLHFGRKLLVLDLLVALEGNAIDHGILDHGDENLATRTGDPPVPEQPGLDPRLEAVVDRTAAELAAGAGLEIRADGLDLNATIADDFDRIDRLRRRR